MTNRSVRLFIVMSVCFSMLVLSPMQATYGQSEVQVECGAIVESEFTQNAEEQIYLLPRKPKESFEVAVEPAGNDLQTTIGIYGPTGLRIVISGEVLGWFMQTSKTPKLASGTLSATGDYKIRVTNTAIMGFSNNKSITSDTLGTDQFFGGIGAYTLSIRCIQSDGSTIEPGESATSSDASSSATELINVETGSVQAPISEMPLPFLELGKTYEIAFGSQTKIIKIVELRNDGWARVEVESRTGWLNLHQVAMVIPIN